MDTQTVALVATLVGVALGALGLLAAWYWRQRGSTAAPAAEVHGAASDRGGAAVVGDRAQLAQSGSTLVHIENLNVYLDGLPDAKTPEVRDHFREGERLQEAGRHRDAIDEFMKAFAVAEDNEQRCALHILAGNSFADLSELREAEAQYHQALAVANAAESKQGQAAALGNLGLVHRALGNLQAAEEHHKKALAIHEETGNRLGQANQLGNLGVIRGDRGDFSAAEEHHKKALAIDEDLGNKLGQAQDFCNLGVIYGKRGDSDESEENFKKALVVDEEIGNKMGQADDLGNLGIVCAKRGDPENAEHYYNRALVIHDEIGNKLGQANQLANLGLLALQRGDASKACHLLQQAAALYEAIGAGGEGPESVRVALQRLEAVTPEE